MPTLTVIGNCQAESLRKLLMGTGHFESHRIPPVHELTTADMPWFGELLKRSDVVVAQPIRDDYRGLPVGTAQAFATAPPHAQQVVVPVLRFDGLMPYQAIIRDPDDSSLNPPVVPYHDLRILVAAAASSGESVAAGAANVLGRAVTPAALRRAAAMSVQQIRNREKRHNTVVISNFLETNPVWHTVNHPNNETLCVLARGVLRTLGLPTESITAPDCEMLGELDAPIEPESVDALGVDPTAVAGRESWKTRNGGVLDEEQIVREQLEFYRQRPRLVAHGLQRHADRIENLGLLA
ncbi:MULTISPECIES: WcbI family polysaccharide biosynthesis putative acetyltransferase [Corynebacterium]|uniref:WcbI family polysaccharide biosynthesis putative acetyltransferase n=1 Tax=Corynebacterium TaxID=1716 RepID=UPI0008A18180|nr:MULTISPECIES: WcbI family polysaccharide biosynthesis putative acetyltransferase [Corynebacterium]OFT90789.1 hypothetical protein HMPREF3098_02185 [Corynebacterium sp. HMSC28B08]